MKNFNGKVLFLDRSDINTDEIIPAKYLTELKKEELKVHCFEDLKLEGFDADRDLVGKQAVISRANFGCGSSREHAPWALEVNGINIVIAENFARIFRQNMFNCGMLAVSLSPDTIDVIFKRFKGKVTELTTDLAGRTFTFKSSDNSMTVPFTLEAFDSELVAAGGWVNYADTRY
jgi:3-isopropylmalate/(R)-2-methylmalate dehydratase small subunit